MRWDSTADAKLFMAVLKVHSLKLNYDAVAKHMGDDCTAKAISHRIAKLKALSGEAGGQVSSGSTSSPNTPTKTPSKRKRNDDNNLITIKKEHFERSMDSDASSDVFIDAVATGSPKKKRRQPKVLATPTKASASASASASAVPPTTSAFSYVDALAAASTISFASTLEDPDVNSPQAASLYSSSEPSPYDDFLHSFAPNDPLSSMSDHNNSNSFFLSGFS